MNEKRFEKWRITRRKGKLYFSLMGILYCGLPLLVVSLVNNWPQNSIELTATIALYAAAGLVFGRIIWFVCEQEYQKEIARRTNTNS